MAKRGGKRPGAGRKKGGTNKQTREKQIIEAEARAHLIKAFLKEWKTTERTIMALAHGRIKTVKYHGKNIQVYEQAPSEKMLQMLVETVIGKPKQPIDGSVSMPELQQLANDIRTILTNKPHQNPGQTGTPVSKAQQTA